MKASKNHDFIRVRVFSERFSKYSRFVSINGFMKSVKMDS